MLNTKMMMLLLLAVPLFLFANGSNDSIEYVPDVPTAVNRYVENLDHHNEGIVTSTMVLLSKIRLSFPDQDLRKAERSLGKMVDSNKPANMRLKAFLTLSLLRNPAEFSGMDIDVRQEPELFFQQVYNGIFGESITASK